MTDRLNDGDDRYDGFGCARCLVATTDNIDAGERTYTVVYANHALGIVGNQCQTVLHRMEASLAAIGQQVLHLEVIFFAELLPISLLRLGQHKDNLQVLGILAEPFQCPHQYGLPAYWQELLRNVATHSQTLAACHNNDIIHYFCIKCLKRMPSAIWSLVALSTN